MKQQWLGLAFCLLTILFIVPVFGVFNQVRLGGLPLNIVWLVCSLAGYAFLAIAWYSSNSTREAEIALDRELDQ